MSNFAKKLEDASEDELKSWINNLDFRVVPLASDELTRRALNKLKKSTNFSSGVMIVLNIFLIIMTGTLIWFAKIQVVPILNEQTRTIQQLLKECKTIYPDNPDYEVTIADGTKMKCSEFIKKFEE